MLQLSCIAATVAVMALVDSDAEICYEVAAEFVCEEKCTMRKVKQEISSEIETSPLPEKRGNEG